MPRLAVFSILIGLLAAPIVPAGAAGPVVRARVAPSGQAIAVECFAADGVTPLAITGFAGLDEEQALTVSGRPGAQSVVLHFGAAATGPIPFRRVPPSTAFGFVATLPRPGTYDVQVCTPMSRGINRYQAYDGVLPVGPAVPLDLASAAPAAHTDPTSNAAFRSIGPRAFATTAATIEATSDSGVNLACSAVRLVPSGGGAAIVVPCNDRANTIYQGDRGPVQADRATVYSNLGGCYPPGFIYSPSFTTNPAYQPASWYLDPADVQRAVEALRGFAGGVKATSGFALGRADSQGGPTPPGPKVVALAFRGTQAGRAIALPAATDPAVQASVVHPGGQPPRIRINGGAPIVLTPDAIAPGSGQSWFLGILPQADLFPGTAAGAYVMTADGYGFRASGGLSGVGAGGIPFTGHSTYLRYGMAGNGPDLFPFEGLPAGQYRLEVTWPVLNWGRPAHGITGSAKGATLAVVDGAGAVLRSESVDQSRAPVGAADPARPGVAWHDLGRFAVASGGTLQVRVSNPRADGGLSIADAVRLTRTSVDGSIRIDPADVVTIDAPSGWLITPAGPAPAMVGLKLPHASGSLLPDPALVRPTMPAGWNACQEDNGGANLWHSNLARRIGWPGFDGVAGVDATLHPTRLLANSGGQAFAYLIVRSGDGESNGPGVPVAPNDPAAVWTVIWDDASGGSAPPIALNNGTASYPEVVLPTTVKGRPTGNRRHFNRVHDPRDTSPTVGIFLLASGPARRDGTYPCSYRNIRVYPPDPATGGAWLDPPVWHPATVARLARGPIRALDLTGAAASNISEVGDVATPAELSLYGSPVARYAVTSIAPEPNPDGYFNPAIGPVVRVTTARPHNLRDLDAVTVGMAAGSPLASPTFSLNGQPYALGSSFEGYNHYIHPTGPTTFTFAVEFNRGLDPKFAGAAMTNTLAAPGIVANRTSSRANPYEDIAALAIEAKCPALHVPIPIQATPALLDHIAACLLRTPKGTLIRAEISNEPWNFTQSEWSRCGYLSHSLGLSPGGHDWVPGYCSTAAAGHARLAAAFAAAGRSADLIRVFGAQQADPGTTAGIAAYCAARKIPVDELTIAPYLQGWPGGPVDPAQVGRFNSYTVEQGLDLLELATEYGPMRSTFGEHRAAIDRAGLKRPDGSPVGISAYEGGFETVIPNGVGSPRGALRTAATLANPRMYRLGRRVLELAQLGGCTAWQEYRFGLKWSNVTWDKQLGTLRPLGTGDPAQDRANGPPFTDKLRLRSQVAGAYRDWQDAVIAGQGKSTAPPGP